MKKNYLIIFVFFIIFIIDGCSFNKDKKKEKRRYFIETIAKPDPITKGLKVRLPKPVENFTWNQATNNEAHQILHPLVGKKITLDWKTSIGKKQSKKNPMSAQPVTDKKIIYTIDSELTISAINISNGKKKWKKKLKKKIKKSEKVISGGLSVNDNVLAVTTGSGYIFILDKNTSKILWKNNITAPIRSAPIISGNYVLVISKDNRLYTYNLENGNLIWTHEGLEQISTFMGSSSPVVSKGIVIVTYSSGEIYAIKLSNGSVIWNDNVSTLVEKKSLENISDIRGNAVIQGNVVYVISHNGKMLAFDLNNGKRIWESNIGGIQTPWIISRFIYVLSKDNELICLTSNTGKIVWVSKLKDFVNFEKKDKLITWTGPLLAGRMLIVSGSHGIVASISPYTGKFLGAINVKSSVETQAIVSNKTIFFLTTKGALLAYR
tara:strand:+ start:1193 stop:2497 length:1305 start_codon:yes stop_codon:yes gene_type:complete